MGNIPNPNTNSNRDYGCPGDCSGGCPRCPCNRCGKPKHHCRCNKNVGCPFC